MKMMLDKSRFFKIWIELFLAKLTFVAQTTFVKLSSIQQTFCLRKLIFVDKIKNNLAAKPFDGVQYTFWFKFFQMTHYFKAE